jgi:hypothetical protein
VLGGQLLAVDFVALWPRGQNWFALQGAQPPLATGYMPEGHCSAEGQQQRRHVWLVKPWCWAVLNEVLQLMYAHSAATQLPVTDYSWLHLARQSGRNGEDITKEAA